MSEEQVNASAEEQVLGHEEILEEYRRRQMIEHLTGPMISLLLHGLVVVACAILLVGREVREEAAFEFNTRELDVKQIDPETLEELDQLEEPTVDAMVPTVEKPTLTPEQMVVQTPDFTDALAATEMDFDVAALDLKMNTSPITLPGLYSNRTAAGREKALGTFAPRGMAGHTERAVLKALRWLKDHQEPDGSWCPRGHPDAMTGLALLAFLAHGETPASEEFGRTVQTAIQWLANYMLPKTRGGNSYTHGIASYALCEAYGLTKIPFIKPAMEKGLSLIVQGQQANGGYDYNYAKGERWDLSVAAWQFQAMKAGYISGANVPGLEEAMLKGIEFMKKTAYKDGKFGYSSPGSGSRGMQGAGTLCLQLMGEGKSLEARTCASETLSTYRPEWKGGGHAGGSYEWYYVNQAIFHSGKSEFTRWNAIFAPMLIENQHADGKWESPEGEKSVYDPYMNTALNALSLMVYYRYLPTYQDPGKIAKQGEDIFGFDEGAL